ncbi:carbohydrate ABC transporter permease [Carboxydochorda subterranea]|uniref:Carbohydrate ABC transporter permease n=1 Tax=Carboxydichorda subterranea TaxID=3109565 RepID=A0ABZ1BXQ8_9FIRM|nr:carbohydrate ABC transporter permease [Limnochorda sp. L945t]WRP17591.1 carbohydrate ABC transporter permease [Limnochorda sp. L945t]
MRGDGPAAQGRAGAAAAAMGAARATTRASLVARGMRHAEALLVYVVLVAVAITTIYPFVWTVVTSFESTGAVFQFPPPLWPRQPTLRNYRTVVETVPLLRYLLNSVVITAGGVLGSLVVAALAGYPLAKLRFAGRNLVFGAIVATLILPNEAGLIVNYITTIKLGLLHTGAGQYAAVVLPSLASTVGIFLMRQAYLAVPDELLEAARVDGATELGIWWRIMVPLAAPSVAAFAILQFVAFWNSFLWPIIVLTDKSYYPLASGLLDLQGQFATNTRAIASGTVIAMVPILAVFVAGQRFFMRGLEGAVKQ